jgi:hypothetical protein
LKRLSGHLVATRKITELSAIATLLVHPQKEKPTRTGMRQRQRCDSGAKA